jgi:hypothetical protein
MHFQSLLTISIAVLAGTSIAADYNGDGVPSVLRKGRTKLRASDLLSGSSSANVATPLPSSSSRAFSFSIPTPSASASTSAVHKSIARPSSSASLSSFKSSTRPAVQSSSAAHRPSQATHAVHQPAASGANTPSSGDASVPVSDLYESASDNPSHKPFWSKPLKDNKGKPNAPDFSAAPDASINSKDGCSTKCLDWANECAELLPHNQDFW